MAQSEDTELRDLVIEALEKNGSLAKIRALLRANIFLAFEDDCENMKQNPTLDSIMKLPEGILSLSIVHEFLEFCNLKNTLFVYKSESRQGQEYKYEGQKNLSERVKFLKRDNAKEPILVTLIKSVVKPLQRQYFDDFSGHNKRNKLPDMIDDQNCTYIVHEDSSSTASNSQSDNSSDEKNKLHLRLQLDNSDTDTSSESARDKSCSEYIPSQHIIKPEANKVNPDNVTSESEHKITNNSPNLSLNKRDIKFSNYSVSNLPFLNSSDSTSYAELKPYNKLEQKLLNTTGVPIVEMDEKDCSSPICLLPLNNHKSITLNDTDDKNTPKVDSPSSSATLSNVSSLLSKNESKGNPPVNQATTKTSEKTNSQVSDYSLDFTSSPTKEKGEKNLNSPQSIKEELPSNEKNPVTNIDSPHQNSQSSQSSVSISDVAELLEYSGRNSVNDQNNATKFSDKIESGLKNSPRNKNKSFSSVDSGDFSESPIPSLSNLSLEIHSD